MGIPPKRCVQHEVRKPRGAYRAVFLALGCGLFIYLLVRLETAQILSLLREIGWSLIPVATVYTGYQLVRTAALWLCVTIHDRILYWELVKIRVTGEAVLFLTFTGPFLAEPAKALLLVKQGMAPTHGFAAIISEFLIYTFTSAAMAVAALSYMLHRYELLPAFAVGVRIGVLLAGVFLAAAAFAILRRFYLIGSVLNGIRALPVIGRLQRIDRAALRKTEDLLFVVLRERPGCFLSVLGLEIIAQALLVLELYILLGAAGQTFSPIDPVLIESSSKFLAVGAFFIPGQIGAAEGMYVAVFAALGLPASAGFSVALARRLCSFLVAGIGLVLLWLHGKRAPRLVL